MNNYTAAMHALCRRDFSVYLQRAFAESQSVEYLHNWHIDLLASALEDCRLGKIRRLIITLPPRSLKSHAVSVCFPTWLLAKDPAAQIILASYGDALASKLSGDALRLMKSPWYQGLFETRLSPRKQSAHEFCTTAGGLVYATSVDGPVTGRGAQYIIIDDPSKPEEVMSDALRLKTNEWFSRTLLSRQNDKNTACIILVMQRLHMDDLAGHLLEQGGWTHISLPAICTEDECWDYRLLGRPIQKRRTKGDLLHPERDTASTLEEIRKQIGDYYFSAQYQQQPVPLGGNLVQRDWLREYTEAERPEDFDQIIQSWDTASKANEQADYSVCTTWGIKDKKIFLLDVLRQRLNYPDLKRLVMVLRQQWRPNVIVIEDAASGIQLIQELQSAGVYEIKPVKPQGEKEMRMRSQTGLFQSGQVYLPEIAPWKLQYVAELLAFPQSKTKDQVDSTSQALAWIHESLQEPYALQYMRMMATRTGVFAPGWKSDQGG